MKQVAILCTLLCCCLVSLKGQDNNLYFIQRQETFLQSLLNRNSLTDSILAYGKSYLHTPYRRGGKTPKGFDCSGFTAFVFKRFGFSLGASSQSIAKETPSIDKKEMRTGDLVFFEGRKKNGRVGHVGIVTETKEDGTFRFIHSSTTKGVIISHSNEEYYTRRFVKAGRIITPTLPTDTVSESKR